MKRLARIWKKVALALVVFPLLGGSVRAAGIGFKNDLKIPIIVQGASFENNVIRRGQPLLIYPGKTVWDLNLKPGNRFITIYDARQPTRILFQSPANPQRVHPFGPIPFDDQDKLFSVRPLPTNPTRVLPVEMKIPPR
jgi:hypothetical protein